jgi:hypothetical protein
MLEHVGTLQPTTSNFLLGSSLSPEPPRIHLRWPQLFRDLKLHLTKEEQSNAHCINCINIYADALIIF